MAKLINQKVQSVVKVPSMLRDTIKHIEWVAKICYQSHDNIKPDSHIKMVSGLIEKEHTAMLEHSWCVFETEKLNSKNIVNVLESVESLVANNKFIFYGVKDKKIYIMGNYRAFMECEFKEPYSWNPIEGSLESLKFALMEDFNLPKLTYVHNVPKEFRAYTAILKTDRAVTHELIRHRPASYGQESQRYVKYNGMEFIKPSWFKKLSNKAEEIFAKNCLEVEKTYKELIDLGLKAQEARVVLSNQVATQIAVTAPIWEWEHIFKLRCSNAAYPQIRELMNETRNEIRKIENN